MLSFKDQLIAIVNSDSCINIRVRDYPEMPVGPWRVVGVDTENDSLVSEPGSVAPKVWLRISDLITYYIVSSPAVV